MPAVDRARIARALPRYTLGEQLGAGSFGLVLAGRHLDLDRTVAVKVLVAPSAAERGFRAEARILSRLDHPHIVRIYDCVVQDDLCLLVMEMLGGGTLSQHRLSAAAALAVGAAVADALAHAHAHGVLHRDIKPDNILFTETGQPKLADFGIGKILDDAAGTVSRVVGSPRYMAPEQIAGGTVGPATDLYALGAVLYELVAGRPMFDAALSVPELLRHQREVDPPVPAAVPPAVRDLVLRALAKNPADRPADARTFAQALGAAAASLFGPGWPADSSLVIHLPESAATPATAETGAAPRFTPAPAPTTHPDHAAAAAAPSVPGPGTSTELPPDRAVPPLPAHPGRPPGAAAASRNLFEGTPYAAGRSQARRRAAVAATAALLVVVTVVVVLLARGGDHRTAAPGSPADGAPPGTPAPGAGGPPAPPVLDAIQAWALAPSGGFYVVNRSGNRLLRLALDGTVSAVAGTGVAGSTGDGGPATTARLRGVTDVAVAGDGTVYLADGGNQRIRRIGPDGVITTVAGGGSGVLRDGARGTEVSLGVVPGPIAADPGGDLYLTGAGGVYRLDRAGVTRMVGRTLRPGEVDDPAPEEASVPPVAASIGDVEVRDGRVFVTDYTADRVQVLEPDGTPRTLAGAAPAVPPGGGPADGGDALSLPSGPSALAVDRAGNLYVAESGGNRVRRIDLGGVVTTVAGTGELGSSGDGGPATTARMWSPARVLVDASGVLYIGETGTTIRRVGPDGVITRLHD
ncbi:serine/threonine protein kinase [Parafrankia colletiae]|uniref:non-specific serine/threonine protein kinase n=1 Tax=Parafrankia colletiae TaxID=573497 RepID=A0A1S1QHQ1_9ACTN|nr:serine/threonine-protein kinase [Parafrankia colletiae]MCK9901456.1 protein kinase [Frankia sp. Cpl3]OHV33500.1 serine/threonine protein kinase [Parafrankia colletiae]